MCNLFFFFLYLQKSVFNDQIEKMLAEADKRKSVADDYNLVTQKYEAAKKKLVQAYSDLNDATSAKEDYHQQVSSSLLSHNFIAHLLNKYFIPFKSFSV